MSNLKITSEITNVLNLTSRRPNELLNYTIPTDIDRCYFYDVLLRRINNTPILLSNGSNKNFKMEYYYPLLEFIVNDINKYYNQKNLNQLILHNLDFILLNTLLKKLTIVSKGQKLLNKIYNHIVQKVNKTQIYTYLKQSAYYGTFGTFLFWLNISSEKSLENLEKNVLDELFVLSIGNSDNRLFEFILEKIAKINKLFLQNELIINKLIHKLAISVVPSKFKLKRIKKLSQYISLVPYFHQMIDYFSYDNIIIKLHMYYYVHPHTFESTASLIKFSLIFVNNEFTINDNYYNQIASIIKTEDELYMINILLTIKYNLCKIDKFKKSLVNKIVKANYLQIIKIIDWENLCNKNDLFNFVIICLVEQEKNLINKYIETTNIFYVSHKMLFCTRFIELSISNQDLTDDNICTIIKINKLLHILRMYVKSKCKTRIIQRKVKIFDLIREINTFSPKLSVPVLAHGSLQYQYQKQKFNYIPPRHLLPGEITIYNNFILKEKADGILIHNIPVGIYPQTDVLNNYQVKAEYIEALDLYLVFDINIPNTTIEDRYNILRSAHPYTFNTYIEKVNSFEDFVILFKKERLLIKKFINDNESEQIKWYPLFACIYTFNKTNIHKELISNIILEQNYEIKEIILNSEPYNCDGLILTPLDGSREIKIKPKTLITVDLMFDNKKWIDKNGYDWSHIIIKPTKPKKEGRIYRCYPTETFDKFLVGDYRFDKKQPNSYNIVNNVISLLNFDWENQIILSSLHLPREKKLQQSLIEIINTLDESLTNQIALLKPEFNKSWLDLGCGKGKLIPLIKKFNPNNYLGLDNDINQLIHCIPFHDKNQDVYIFTPCDLSKNWSNIVIKWYNINKNIKYDYIVANCSLMNFCNNEFWNQLNEITHVNSKFIFNVICPPNNTNLWIESESYLHIDGNKTIYKFEWIDDEEKIEPFISDEELNNIVKRNGWNIQEKKTIISKHTLINFYKWWIISKN